MSEFHERPMTEETAVMTSRWRWRPRGLLTLAFVMGLTAWAANRARWHAPKNAHRSPIAFTGVPSPSDQESALVPLRPEAARALRDVAGALTGILLTSDDDLRHAEAEFRDYHDTVLRPRILAPWTAVSDDEVLALDFDRDGRVELVVLGTWRDTFFMHGLRFVAALEQSPSGRYHMAMFQRLDRIVDGFTVLDVNGDEIPEVVLSVHDGWRCAATVIARTNRTWSTHSLDSSRRAELSGESARCLFVTYDGERERSHTWSPMGFESGVEGGE